MSLGSLNIRSEVFQIEKGDMKGKKLLRGDFHIHTWYSRDSLMTPQRLVERAIQVGLSCIAVTDHNTIEGALAVQRCSPPFTVIVGEEVKSVQGEIIGLFLEETVPSRLSALETVRRIKEQGGIVYVPHPFDRFRSSVIRYEALIEILPYIDIIEAFNARNLLLRDSEKAGRFAKEHGKLAAAGSDSHASMELGSVFVELAEFQGPEEFLQALSQSRFVGRRSSPLVHLLSRYAKIRKSLRPSLSRL